ncbi:cupin domain-containing protein [Leucobacter sp. CSA1]|uniref:Cupin domain-containing protein n=1 Tax=Leucobacter chromiisoli TaxID=2796471 RepID=A0A934USN4_9MICO|nr:cupin domain-containing protein [Leucobacter chromiisoli]MBK0417484.1 cupin domain-containing protein [Leucobacter chromiisoli]
MSLQAPDPDPRHSPQSGEVEIGPRIRELREASGMSLRGLARASGLSVGFLSQVERGISSIALSSLRAVADALGHPMSELFETEGPPSPDDDSIIFTLMRGSERKRSVVSGGRHYEMLSARAPGLILEPMLVYIEPGGVEEPPVSHAGEEFAYVLSGRLVYEVAGEEHLLEPGDSLYLRSNTPHAMRNDGTETCVVVSVVTPRHY